MNSSTKNMILLCGGIVLGVAALCIPQLAPAREFLVPIATWAVGAARPAMFGGGQ